MRSRIWSTFLLLLVLALSACQETEPASDATAEIASGFAEATASSPGTPSAHVVDVAAFDYAFGMPTEIPSGWTTFRMENKGNEHHVLVLQRIPQGVTAEEVEAVDRRYTDLARSLREGAIDTAQAMEIWNAQKPAWLSEMITVGGPGLIAPGRTAQTTVHLKPGLYGLSCGVKTPGGTTHFEEGMRGSVYVTEESSGAAEPTPDVQITVRSHEFVQEGKITPGTRTIGVHFAEQPDETHDVHLVRLQEGQTAEDVAEWMEGVREPSPFQFLGGAEQMPAGETAYFTAEFEPGRYAWVCHGHADKGMVHEFTVE